ncbi:heme ABC exporter ATP-binding protein CcmA [Breoghania sp. L-A4]|uniref:heme ABC exporter ATP-binding protein CcmA n=1 Tax=Breoghania sp. L-A4 TaxID=2304600 RepID=UPI000E35BC74|nr:heme ABC exporter ATP-binding protein CcmA [Breoghania sp. L-A4]AXS38921.1 heme ABC exporter ATP-binding protein CcmA [Breoghania sp. L-A4]
MLKLVADRLAVDRGGRQVFAELSFSVLAGEALLVRGPNGVGKSSLLRTIAGLVPAAEGTIRIERTGEEEAAEGIGARCHYFGHSDALKTPMTVAENLGFWRDFHGHPSVTVDQALDRVGLADIAHLPAAYLSAGQRRRLSLSRLLVSHRPVWLLDEPTSALDAASEQALITIMQEHLASGGLIIAATHADLPLDGARALWMQPGAGGDDPADEEAFA